MSYTLCYLVNVPQFYSAILIAQSIEWNEASNGLKLSCRSMLISNSLILHINKIQITFTWKDQGWGYRKGRVIIKVLKNSEELFIIEDWSNPAPHFKSTVKKTYDVNHKYVKDLIEGCHFELWYVVGGGGGHSLEITDFSLIFFTDDNRDDVLSFVRAVRDGNETEISKYNDFVDFQDIQVQKMYVNFTLHLYLFDTKLYIPLTCL